VSQACPILDEVSRACASYPFAISAASQPFPALARAKSARVAELRAPLVSPGPRVGYARWVIPREKVAELVNAHARLEEPTTGAIWIRPEAGEAWLVEVIPSMTDDEKAEEPTFFNPGTQFRFPVAIIAGNRRSLEAALRRQPDLARAVASGTVLLDAGDASALVDVARAVAA